MTVDRKHTAYGYIIDYNNTKWYDCWQETHSIRVYYRLQRNKMKVKHKLLTVMNNQVIGQQEFQYVVRSVNFKVM